MLANEIVDILAPIHESLARAGIDPDAFLGALGRNGPTAFVQDLPTRSVTVDLLRARASQQKWEPNDLNDVVYLPAAAVHGDVVVTEKQSGPLCVWDVCAPEGTRTPNFLIRREPPAVPGDADA